MKKQRHKYAFDANMHKLGVVTDFTEQCAKEYAELTASIEKLEKPGRGKDRCLFFQKEDKGEEAK